MASYGSKVDTWLDEDGLMLLQSYSRDGMTMSDIAEKIGVAKATLVHWCQTYPEIRHSVYQGRELVDYKVENALLKSALGYTTRESKVVLEIRAGKLIETKRETTVKEIAPNVSAIMFWLNNRKTGQWKRNRDNVLETDDKDNNIVVNIYHNGKKANVNNSQDDDDNWDDDWEAEVNSSETQSSRHNAESYNEPEQSDSVGTDTEDWDDDWDKE